MTNELNQAFFLGGSSSDDLWFPRFLLEVFVPKKYVRAMKFSFLNSSLILILEYITVVSSSEEPSNSPYSQEWPLSSVGRGTLQGGTGSNPVEA